MLLATRLVFHSKNGVPEWIEVILLGIIEGITEFLPISSTGHLLLARNWMSHHQSDLFLVFIQSGAVLAVAIIYRARLLELIMGWREKGHFDFILKLLAAFVITGIGGLLLKYFDFELPETSGPVGWALLIGGLLFIWIERWLRGKTLLDEVSWGMAIAMGFAQLAAAIFPGTSRSGATILIALLMGLKRPKAVEFSFLLGIPTLLAAGGLVLVSDLLAEDTPDIDWFMLFLGTVVSGVVGFVAVKWLLKFISQHTFSGFGWYRVILGILVLWIL